MNARELVILISEAVPFYNALLLRSKNEPPSQVPDWRQGGEDYLVELAQNAGVRIHRCAEKGRWGDFLRNLARLATHIVWRVVRSEGGDTAYHVLGTIFGAYAWRLDPACSDARDRFIAAAENRSDPRREATVVEILSSSYSRS